MTLGPLQGKYPPRKQGMEARGTSLSITPNDPPGDLMLVIPPTLDFVGFKVLTPQGTQYPGLENSMGCIVHGVAKSQSNRLFEQLSRSKSACKLGLKPSPFEFSW